MKNNLKTIYLISTLCFSIFCFCYLNFSAANTSELPSDIPGITKTVMDTKSETNEILLPDLRFVESASQFLARLFKVL